MDDLKELSKAIMEILRNDFESVDVIDVHVDRDTDWEGDEILRVEVVFEGQQKDIEPRFFSSAIRRIRPALSEREIFAFPSMSFVSSADVKAQAS